MRTAITCPPSIASHHWAELVVDSAIAPDVAAANIASFGAGTERHWETERAELVAHARYQIQTESTTKSGWPQTQPGYLADRLISLDCRYRHLAAGGWRSLSAKLPGLPRFNQWKPAQPREHHDRPGHTIKYETPPAFPDGGGLLLPRIPDRVWQLICRRQGLPLPADRSGGFWAWALITPELQLLICEGFKKALAALTAGHAAVALPGIQMGRRCNPDGSERLIEALLLLGPGHTWLVVFDAERTGSTGHKVAGAAGALARALRAAGGRPKIAHLPLLPGASKTGLDDLLAAAGPEALNRALANTGPTAVLPWLRRPDRIATAGSWLGVVQPLPSPAVAPLVVVRAPMGAGKTRAAADALAPLAAAGVPVLIPSHRQALGQAAAKSLGVPWCPAPGTDERLQGVAGCWDSWCLDSALRIRATDWSGGALVLDEWQQAIEHLLLSSGTALADRRAEVLRTAAKQLPRMLQTLAMDAQLADWGVRLLERLSGRRAVVITSEHQPMAGRPLHAPANLKTASAAANAFHARWAELVAAGAPFLCWCSAQRADVANSAQRLAALHQQRRPNDLVDVIDSSTPELAAKLASDPDGFAEQRATAAQQLNVSWALYCSPAISSGISFHRWRPAAVVAYAGGRIAPEQVAQALARVRCPAVPGYVFAPECCPGAALRVGSGATNPARLIADLQAVADPLYGQLAASDAEGAWLQAWGELGATRNRQRFAYRATIAGLLQAEGWELQTQGPESCPIEGAKVRADLKAAALAAREAADRARREVELLTPHAAAKLMQRRRPEPGEQIALDRFRLDQRWALHGRPLSQAVIDADRDGLRERLQMGWLLTTTKAAALVPDYDWRRIEALDSEGRPFAPDRLRVTVGSRLAALIVLGLPSLLQRFAAGEVIASNDPAVMALHASATAHRGQLTQAAGLGPAKLASGTLRTLLDACGWKLRGAGRIKTRSNARDVYRYRAAPIALPEGVEAQALATLWLAELQAPTTGAKSSPTEISRREEKSPTAPPPPRLLRPITGLRSLLRALSPPRAPASASGEGLAPCARAHRFGKAAFT